MPPPTATHQRAADRQHREELSERLPTELMEEHKTMQPREGTFDVRATRVFPVAVEAAYAAWVTPELVMRWWGPQGFTCPVAAMDVRPGGTSLVAMRAPAELGGGDMYNTWTYTAVDAPHRLEYVMRFSDATGRSIRPADIGIPAGVPDAVPHLVTFQALDDDRTQVDVTEYGYTDEAARDMSHVGLDQCLDKLEVVLGPR